MATNFGYVKQNVDSQVNWGEVGKTFTDMLSAENKRREDLKTEIDTNTRTDLERLAQIPKGSSEDYNKWTTDAADKIAQARLLQVKELKAGRLSLKDYNNYRQNTVSGVNNMVTTIKSYNAWFENGMKRAEKMESGAAELWKNSLIESMKFKDTTPNIGLDGSMSVTKQVKNPKTGLMEVSTNPADAFSFSSMLDFGKKQFDRFKAAETLDGLSKTVGDYVKVLNQGNVGLVQDIWQTDSSGKYKNPQIGAIQNQVKASIANPNNAMSVLVDFKGATPSGGKYEFTNDPNDPRLKGPNKDDIIFMDSTMSPQLTEGQMKRAEDIMIEGLKARSGHVETAYERPRPTYREPKEKTGEAQESTSANMLRQIYSGKTDAEVKAGLQYFAGLNPEWKDIDVDKAKGTINITDEKGNVTPINMKDQAGNLLNFSDVAKSATFLTGIKDINKALSASGITSETPYSQIGGSYSRRKPKEQFDTLSTGEMVGDKYMAIPTKDKLTTFGEVGGIKNKLNAGVDYAKGVLENFNSSDTQGSVITSVTSEESRKIFKDDTPRIKVFLPKVMEQPAYLKVLGQDSDKSLLENAMRALYNYAGTGGPKLKPYQLNEMMTGKKAIAPKTTQPKTPAKGAFNAEDFYKKNKSK